MIQVFHQIIHYELGRTYNENDYSWEYKTINNKIKQKKDQYNYRQTAIMSALLSGNFEFLTRKDVLPDLLAKAAALKSTN